MAGQPIKVMHLVGSGAYGGENSCVTQLLGTVDRTRFALGVRSFGSDGPAFEAMRRMGFDARPLDVRGRYGPAAVGRYLGHLVNGGYRILHAHVGSRVPRFVARIAGCSTIAHVHGLPEAFAGQASEDRIGLGVTIRSAVAAGSHSVVACSSDTSAMLAKACPELGPRLSVIRNGIDPGRWRPLAPEALAQERKAAGLAGTFAVGFAGRLVPLKRVDSIIEAAEHAVRKHPELLLCILGDGPSRAALEGRARNLGDRIRFLGWQDSARWMPLFDVLVLPSESEGLPFCILEAMACGVPVIASAVGGIPEAVVDGETGLLVQPGSAPELLLAIEALLGDADTRLRMGRAGRQRVEESFGVAAMAGSIEDLYTGLRHGPEVTR